MLRALLKQRYITADQYTRAVEKGLGLHPSRRYSRIRQPYIFNYVQRELIQRYGINTVRTGGLKVYTTISPRLQDAAQKAVDACAVCYPNGGPASALASVDPDTGEIVALASSQHYSGNSQFNFAAQAHRQPGSSFKPFVLTTAIKQGVDPNSTYYDGSSPKTLTLPGGGAPWTVNNAEPGNGTMSLTDATVNSVNAVFAQLVLDVGVQAVRRHRVLDGDHLAAGHHRPRPSLQARRSAATSRRRPRSAASARASRRSRWPTPTPRWPTAASTTPRPRSRRSSSPTATSTGRPAPPATACSPPGEAYEVTRILEGVITKGTGAGYTSIGCGSEAGKTGTTDGLSDAWFVGYTPLYSTAVWTGHPLSRSYTGFGGPTSGPIWRSYMEAAQGNHCPDFPVPAELPALGALHSGRTSSAARRRRRPRPAAPASRPPPPHRAERHRDVGCRAGRAASVEQAVAHQGERVGERQDLRDPRSARRAARLIGNSEPAKNHGTIAIAGTRGDVLLLPSDAAGERLGDAVHRRSRTARAAATNQATPAALRVEVDAAQRARRRSARATWSAVTASATTRLPSTSSGRGIGAASSSRWAPLSRSTITPSPANIVFSGISRPTVPIATNAS